MITRKGMIGILENMEGQEEMGSERGLVMAFSNPHPIFSPLHLQLLENVYFPILFYNLFNLPNIHCRSLLVWPVAFNIEFNNNGDNIDFQVTFELCNL